jgi:hypothetical protein
VDTILSQPGWDGALWAACFVRLLAKGDNHSRRRLSRIPSHKALVASVKTHSGTPGIILPEPPETYHRAHSRQ